MTLDEAGYLRGGGARTARPGRVLVGLSFAALAALFVVLLLQAVGESSRADRLHARGVPVEVTVTGCLGMASGTGITESSFQCKGTFVEDGHRYTEVIHGSAVLLQNGQSVQAVVVPGEPGSLSTLRAASGVASRPRWESFIGAGSVLGLLIILTIGVWRRSAGSTGRDLRTSQRPA